MRERRAVLGAVVTAVAGTMPVFLVGALGPQLRADLGFGRGALGAAIGLCQVTSAASAWMLGRRVVAWGASRAARASAALSAASLAAIALVASDWATLVACLVLCGLANAIGQPATNAVIAAEVAEARRGRAFGVKMAAIPLGSVLSGLLVPAVAVPVGWRASVAAALALPVLALVVVPTTPHVRPSRRSPLPPAATPLAALALFAGGVGLAIGAASSVPSFFVDAAQEAGMGESAAGVALAAGGAAGVVARLLVGRRVDGRARTSARVVATMIAVGASGFFALALPVPPTQVAGALVVFAVGWGWVGLFQYLLVAANPANPGAATGVADTGGFLGASVGPVVVGLLADRSSFTVAWVATGVAAAVGAALVEAGSRRARAGGAPVEISPQPAAWVPGGRR